MNRLSAAIAMTLLFTCMEGFTAPPADVQRGALLFMDYCSGCHALRYLSNNQIAVPPVSMPVHDARRWFGQVPPDLSLTAKARGRDWLYTYLTSFYHDSRQPFGTNNRLVPDLMMPNPLAPLTAQELDGVALDLVVFLTYVAEPSASIRLNIGVGVMLFFVLLLSVVYRLKRLYWRRINK